MRFLSLILVSISSLLTVSAATFTVVNTNDSGAGSLRQAILDSNGTLSTNTITFDIPGTGLRQIKLLSALPPVTRAVTIDGFTQPGASPNTLSNGNNANWLIELDGALAGASSSGLELGTDVTVRGLRISSFQRFGIDIVGDNSVVAGCFIYSNRFAGIQLEEGENGVIGGAAGADRNVISGNLAAGIVFDDQANFHQLIGNFIGTDATGTGSFGNQGGGIHILGHVSDIRIGGTNTGEGNVIAFNSIGGVRIEFFSSWNNSIRGNRIFSNDGLGIGLGFIPGAVTTNDFGDGDDFGGNHWQNFPVITNAVVSSVTTAIQGSLNSQSNTQYALDFYTSTECDASGYGEGEFYFATASVRTDGNGNANFEVVVPAKLHGRYLTGTATDPAGNTSEFSPCLAAPLRLEFTTLFGGNHQLVLGNVDGSPVTAGRLPRLRVLAATNLLSPNVWTSITNGLVLTNGMVLVQGLDLTNGSRFFRSIESQ